MNQPLPCFERVLRCIDKGPGVKTVAVYASDLRGLTDLKSARALVGGRDFASTVLIRSCVRRASGQCIGDKIERTAPIGSCSTAIGARVP